MDSEKRRQPRVEPRSGEALPVQIVGADTVEVGVVHDLSEGGLGLRVSGSRLPTPARDGRVDVILVLPGEAPLTLRGEIRHSEDSKAIPGFYGVEITGIHEEDMQALHHYLGDRLGDFKKA